MNPYGNIYMFQFPNGIYIGQTVNLKERLKSHKRAVKGGCELPSHKAMRKYPHIIPTIIGTAYSKDELNELEIKLIDVYNSWRGNNRTGGYNITKGGGGQSGNKWPEERKTDWCLVQQQRNIERPDIAANHSILMKKLYEDEPKRGREHGEKLKQLYVDNPKLRDTMSTIKIKQNEDNPEMKKQQSEIKLMMYEDKPEMKEKARQKTLEQWSNPDSRKKLLDSHRKRGEKEFDVYKDEVHICTFDYVPDCAEKLFGKKTDGGNIHKVLNGERIAHKGYVFKYLNKV